MNSDWEAALALASRLLFRAAVALKLLAGHEFDAPSGSRAKMSVVDDFRGALFDWRRPRPQLSRRAEPAEARVLHLTSPSSLLHFARRLFFVRAHGKVGVRARELKKVCVSPSISRRPQRRGWTTDSHHVTTIRAAPVRLQFAAS